MCVCVHDMPEVEMPFNQVGSRVNIMAIDLDGYQKQCNSKIIIVMQCVVHLR